MALRRCAPMVAPGQGVAAATTFDGDAPAPRSPVRRTQGINALDWAQLTNLKRWPGRQRLERFSASRQASRQWSLLCFGSYDAERELLLAGCRERTCTYIRAPFTRP